MIYLPGRYLIMDIKETCIELNRILHMSPEDMLLVIGLVKCAHKKEIVEIKELEKEFLEDITDESVKQIVIMLLNNQDVQNNWMRLCSIVDDTPINIEETYHIICEISRIYRNDMILTPSYIGELCYKILDVNENDILYDPCMGLGNVLIPSNAKHIIGIESVPMLYAIAYIFSFIYEKDAYLVQGDCRRIKLQYKPNKCILNPPYTMGTLDSPEDYELSYIHNALNALEKGGKLACIVPQSVLHINKI